MSLMIALSAGHHNKQRGNPVEIGLTGEITAAYLAELRRRGHDVRCLTPDDGRGFRPESLDTVAADVVRFAHSGWIADLYIETHTQAGPPGVFCIYPDWDSDVDFGVLSRLGPDLASRVGEATGLGVWERGIMSEVNTAIGSGGDRLGIFRATEAVKTTTTRLIVEHGSHTDAGNLAILQRPDTAATIARTATDAIEVFFGLSAATVTSDDDARMEAVYQQYRAALGAKRFAGTLDRPYYRGPVLVAERGIVTPAGLLDARGEIDDLVTLWQSASVLRRY